MKRPNMFVAFIAFVGFIAFVALALLGCAKKAQEEAPVAQAPLVRVVAAGAGDITSKISLTGSIVPWQDTFVAPKITGKLEQVFVEEGQKVKEGEPLVLIEKIDYELAARKAQAALMTAKANLENAQLNFERMKTLLERGTISKYEYDKFDAAYKTAQAQAQDAEASLNVAEDKLKNTSISAPFAGFVTQKLAEVGEQASPAGPVMRITNIDKVKVETDVPQNFLGQIQIGQPARIRVDSYPDEIFEGRIFTIRPAADVATRTFNVKIEADNPKYLLKGGMFANVDIILARHENAVILPRDVIVFRDGASYVFVVQDQRVQVRQVQPGISEANNVEITSGVSPGEIVVVSGQGGLEEGMLVRTGE